MVSLEDRTQGIANFKITTRINEGITSFNVSYKTPLKPSAFTTGQQLNITLYDVASPGQTTILGGRIQRIKRNKKDANKIYEISGRNDAYFLVKNGFALDGSLTSNTTFTANEMLETILADEPITIGGGTPSLDDNELFHTNKNINKGYSGIWSTKKKAIDSLFKLYAQAVGANRIRWYIDNENKLRWFETGKRRGNIINIYTEGNDLTISFDIDENAENIVNDLTGYGCDDSSIKSHQSNSASIARFGLQVGDNITDSSIKTQADMDARVSSELEQKAWPIYTATLTLKKYYDIEVGQQVYFKDDPDYPDILFTCTQKEITGNPADITTTLSFSTDESAIAPPTDTDVTKAIVSDAITSTKTNLGTVVDVSEDDCTQLLVRPNGKDTLVNVKSTNSCVNYNNGMGIGNDGQGIGSG